MYFAEYCLFLKKIEDASSGNQKIEIVCDLMRSLEASELPVALYFLLSRLGPMYENPELHVSEEILLQAMTGVFGHSLSEDLKSLGDIGLVAEQESFSSKSNLCISDVHNHLLAVSGFSGDGSVSSRVEALSRAIKVLGPLESRYFARFVVGKLRLGLAEAKILDALSILIVGDKSLRSNIEDRFNVFPDIGYIAVQLLKKGDVALDDIHANVGTPILPAKSERLSSIEAIFEKLSGEGFVIEPKMDGFRLQIHYSREKGLCNMYSRGLNNLSEMFPEIRDAIKKIGVESVVFDTEVIAVDEKSGDLLTFQETIKRKRKHDVGLFSEELPIKVYVFDVLLLNNQEVLGMPLGERFKILRDVDFSSQKVFETVRQDKITSIEQFEKLFYGYVEEGLEGVMCKRIQGEYSAGRRNFNWVKYKRTAEEHLVDTFDVVVMGYFKGKGKRQKLGIGSILVGVFNKKEGTYQSLAKVGTGLKDEEWSSLKQSLDGFIVNKVPDDYDIPATLKPDVVVLPSVILEVAADEVTLSPVHTAGRGMVANSGFALRFPRFVRFRNDKSLSEITTAEEVASMSEAIRGK